MKRPLRSGCSGFTLLELLIVIAIMALLAGVLVEATGASVDAEKMRAAPRELDDIGRALDAYYYDHGAFPAALTSAGFHGTYVFPGHDDNLLKDEWARDSYYRYVQTTSSPDVVVVYAIGPDGVDSGAGSETYAVTVHGAAAGARRTRERLQAINAAVTQYVAAGGTLSGTWSAWTTALGLSASLQSDGFGTAFRVDSDGRTVRSAGADRTFDTSDDLTF